MRFRNLAILSAALCSTAAFAADLKTVNVPFSFVAKNHAYAAGSYTVGVDWTKSMVTLSKPGSEPLTWIIVPAESGNKVSLTFDVAGSEHVLRTIRYQEFATPNLDSRPKHAVESTTTLGE
jgi:opacity protein-like surface antigen